MTAQPHARAVAQVRQAFEAQLAQVLAPLQAPSPLWLAYSGGLDSTVLLHLLAQHQLAFTALHVNHQLSPKADQWQAHCEAQCATMGVPFVGQKVQVQARGRGLEDAARQARHAVFEATVPAGGWLLTAHHQDDQAETLLLRLLRGAGVEGLAAMASVRPLGAGHLLRPLLGLTRAQLEAYGRAYDLRWVEDDSNRDTDFDRNYVRQHISPLLSARWPGQSARLAQTAAHCREAQALLTEVARGDAPLLDERRERWGISVALTALAALSPARLNNLLRFWLSDQGLVLSTEQLAELKLQWLGAAEDAQPALRIGVHQLLRFQGRGYLMPQLPPEISLTPQPLAPGAVLAAGPMRFTLRPAASGIALPPEGHWWVRTRQAGDRCQPVHRARSQSLKKCLQESALEPWWRPWVPLVCAPKAPEEIWAVGDLWLDKRAPQPEKCGYQPVWWFESDDS